MNSFISSSLGSSIMYFCTKIFGTNPAVAYLTNVSSFSVQKRIHVSFPVGSVAGCQEWMALSRFLLLRHVHSILRTLK